MSEQRTEIRILYPTDPRTLPRVYSNHVNVYALNEEVYLDFCSIEPQRSEDVGPVKQAEAALQIRVVITKQHAERLLQAVKEMLDRSGP
ncbi:MAG: DUF3467 domain-containing protein [Planctomycetes bacterium]|nr:DUF3467 domain-containing protein [Planctomycetota bacterium]